MGTLKAAVVWFQGKKTMLGGLVLIAAAVAGTVTGKLPVDQGAIVLGFGISICGWSAKANRHQAEILAALQTVAVAGAQVRAGNKTGAMQTVEAAAIAGVVNQAEKAAAAGSGTGA
jgi:hypothetical protein